MQGLDWKEGRQWRAQEGRAAEGDIGGAIQSPQGPEAACWMLPAFPQVDSEAMVSEGGA